jgi:hypothetical protein
MKKKLATYPTVSCGTDMRDIDLKNSKITSFAQVIDTNWGYCSDVNCLDLSGNRITSFEGLEHFTQLKVLKLNDNGYDEIPEGLNRLASEYDIELHLRNNNIKSLGGLVMNGISHLYLENNQFNNMSEDDIQKISNPIFKDVANPYNYHIYLKGNPFYDNKWINKIEINSIVGSFYAANELPLWDIVIFNDAASIRLDHRSKFFHKVAKRYLSVKKMDMSYAKVFQVWPIGSLELLLASLYVILGKGRKSCKNITGINLFSHLLKNKNIPIQLVNNKLGWYGFAYNCQEISCHVYAREEAQTRGSYQVYFGEYYQDDSIITSAGKYIEGKDRIRNYELINCSKFWSRTIYFFAQKRYNKLMRS